MVSGGFRLDFLLETARLARSTYYYQLKQLDGLDKDKIQIYELRKQGYSLEQLSNKFGINNSILGT